MTAISNHKCMKTGSEMLPFAERKTILLAILWPAIISLVSINSLVVPVQFPLLSLASNKSIKPLKFHQNQSFWKRKIKNFAGQWAWHPPQTSPWWGWNTPSPQLTPSIDVSISASAVWYLDSERPPLRISGSSLIDSASWFEVIE